MKIVVIASYGGKERPFDVPCGEGDKSFKWLSNCITQRFALSAPNGTLRRKETLRGDTERTQALATVITLPNGDSPHPASLICDFLADGEVVRMEMLKTLEVDESGVPSQSEWATLAFSTNSMSGLSMGGSFGDMNTAEEEEEYKVEPIEVENRRKGNAMFMKAILNSQNISIKATLEEVEDRWEVVGELMPRMNPDTAKALKAVIAPYWSMLIEVYQNYSPMNAMMKREMTQTDYFHFVEDADIFAVSDFEELTMRTWRRCSRGLRAISLGEFIACLLMLSQARLNDIFDKEKATLYKPVEAVEIIVGKKILKLAQSLNVSSFVRYVMFSSDQFLSKLREMHEDLFLVFEKYCAKASREASVTLTMELMANVLCDAKLLQEEGAPEAAADLYTKCRTGIINGRFIPADIDVPAPPDDEFTFAEYVEAICRIPFREEGSLEGKSLNKIIETMLECVQRVRDLVNYTEPEVVEDTKASRRRK